MELSRSAVSGLPWKYFEATMFVAVCDHDLGTSTFSCRKMTWPLSFKICAVRRSHSTASKGEILPSVNFRWNSRPVLPDVSCRASRWACVFPFTAILGSAICLPPRREIFARTAEGRPGWRETLLFYSQGLGPG